MSGVIDPPEITTQVKDELARFREDSQYLDRHHDRFVKQYPDQWIAIYHKKVVGVHSDFEMLLEMLRKKGVSPGEAVIELMTTEKVTWILSGGVHDSWLF